MLSVHNWHRSIHDVKSCYGEAKKKISNITQFSEYKDMGNLTHFLIVDVVLKRVCVVISGSLLNKIAWQLYLCPRVHKSNTKLNMKIENKSRLLFFVEVVKTWNALFFLKPKIVHLIVLPDMQWKRQPKIFKLDFWNSKGGHLVWLESRFDVETPIIPAGQFFFIKDRKVFARKTKKKKILNIRR